MLMQDGPFLRKFHEKSKDAPLQNPAEVDKKHLQSKGSQGERIQDRRSTLPNTATKMGMREWRTCSETQDQNRFGSVWDGEAGLTVTEDTRGAQGHASSKATRCEESALEDTAKTSKVNTSSAPV